MTTDDLSPAPRSCAAGPYPLEAGAALLTASGAFPHRGDFTGRFTQHGTSKGTAMAAVNREAAITAPGAGKLPCSAGERRLLTLSASLADGTPVDLRDAATGLDDRNIQQLLTAILHASVKRPESSRY